MKQQFRWIALIGAAFSLASLSALAQTTEERTLQLQTDGGQIPVPLEDGIPLRILSDGDISATAEPGFSCPTDGPTCDDVQVSLRTVDGGAFTLSPNPVTQGSNVTINWNGRGAWSCEGAGLSGTTWNTSNPKDPNGVQSVNTGPLTAGSNGTDYTVELTCSNGPVTDTRNLTLTVEEDSGPPPPQGCENVPELASFSGWQEASSILLDDSSHDPNSFADVFNGPFPGTTNTAHIEIRKGQYASIQFQTPGTLLATDDGQFNSVNAGQIYPGGDQRLVSITKCPGVFDPQHVADDDCLKSLGISTPMYWEGPNSPQAAFWCNLEPNQTYFLNILYSRSDVGDFPPEQAPCESGETHCSSLMYHSSSLQ